MDFKNLFDKSRIRTDYKHFVLIDGENLSKMSKDNKGGQLNILEYLNDSKIFNDSYFICICKSDTASDFLKHRILRDNKIIFRCELDFFDFRDFREFRSEDHGDWRSGKSTPKNLIGNITELNKQFTCQNIPIWRNIAMNLLFKREVLHDHIAEYDDHLLVELANYLDQHDKTISIVTQESNLGENLKKLSYATSFIKIFIDDKQNFCNLKLKDEQLVRIKNFKGKQIEETMALEYIRKQKEATGAAAAASPDAAATDLLEKANEWCEANKGNIEECTFDAKKIKEKLDKFDMTILAEQDLFLYRGNIRNAKLDDEVIQQWKILLYEAQTGEKLGSEWRKIFKPETSTNNKYYYQYLKYKTKYINLKQTLNK